MAAIKMESDREQAGYWPRIIVKFLDDFDIPYEDRAEQYLDGPDGDEWKRLEKQYPGITLNRLLRVISPGKILALVEIGQHTDPDYTPPNLLTWFLVDAPEGVVPAIMARSFLEWPAVQNAYFDPPGDDPSVYPDDDCRFPDQEYLGPAPKGIDAEYVWPRASGSGFKGGDGEGIRFVDMEQGWTAEHEDLVAHAIPILPPAAIKASSRSHGTRVLGVVCAVDNAKECIGIAPNPKSVDLVSHHGATRADTILAGIGKLEFGDVLLIESQLPINGNQVRFPVEVQDDCFDMIRLATAIGIVVIEAAANGNYDLDNHTDSSGKKILKRTNTDFRDSGAIMVAAAVHTVPHSRYIHQNDLKQSSNYGSRIDCYAWGSRVTTLDSDNTGSTTGYTRFFGQTSAASAIIAGAALVVQGMAEASLLYRFSARQLRQILSKPATSTASASTADKIGVMPCLRAIAEGNVLNLAPDAYIRDYVGDDGDPHSSAISASPDIILLAKTVPNPQQSFGEGSGTENSALLGSQALAGQDNYIYVRVRNRGGSAALNVLANLYWAPVASLLTPDLWTRVGSTTLASVPAGNVLTVSAPVTWEQSEIPATGHYCFIGVIGNSQDPEPDLTKLLDWQLFRRFIRENNNVTWRNFNVVSNQPQTSGVQDVVILPFMAPGAPYGNYMMQIGVGAKLPRGARIHIEIPEAMEGGLEARNPAIRHDIKKQTLLVPANPHGEFRLKPVLFPARSRRKLKLLVHIPEAHRKHPYEVYVNQFFEDQEVGRVTWRLVPDDRYKTRD